ncbi:GTPase IMAP family member 7-like, partial [Lagopus leucura]|uniref:GTPase IMAP family member 7-like n=1 Tax=Lagopus leucura TaxID=30410 RepID=UPI001C678E32
GNTILGKEEFESYLSPQSVTQECKEVKGCSAGWSLVVVDTPGFHVTVEDNLKTAEKKAFQCLSGGVHAIVLVMQLGPNALDEQKEAEWLSKMSHTEAHKYTILLFTRAEELKHPEDLKSFIERSGCLKELAAKCGNRYLGFSNRATGEARDQQVAELISMIDAMVEQNRDAPCYTREMLEKVGTIV